LAFNYLIFDQKVPKTLKQFKENMEKQREVVENDDSIEDSLSLLIACSNIGGYIISFCFGGEEAVGKNKEEKIKIFTKLHKVFDVDDDQKQICNVRMFEDLSFILFTRQGQIYTIYGDGGEM
jgi:hypothetical protein